MNDGRVTSVQEVEAFENLTAPGLENLDVYAFKALQVHLQCA